MRRSTLLLCTMFAAAAAAVSLHAVQPAKQRPTFRGSVEIVRVDVSVLDDDRRPVSGLVAEDFTILVDGVPQTIETFMPVTAALSEPTRSPWAGRVFSDVRTNRLRDPRLFVIVMDDASTDADPFQIQTAIAVARAVVEQLGPDDLASVVFTSPYRRRRGAQELTHDRTKLLEAIETFNFGPTGSPGAWMSRRTLKDVLTFLHERPEIRSSVVFVGPSMNDGLAGFDGGSGMLWGEREMAQASTGNALSRVPIYWFDTRGLEAPGLTRRPVDAVGSGPVFSMNNRPYQGPAFIDESGGRSIMRTNAPADHVPAMFEENRLYYLLGFRPTYPPTDGRSRRIQVRVKRPGVHVFPGTRTFRSVKPSTRRSTSSELLSGAIAGLLPQAGLPLEMTVATFAVPDKDRRLRPMLCVNVAVSRPAPTEPLEERVQLMGAVFSLTGKKLASMQREAGLKLLPTGADSRFELLSRFDLKPGRYVIRYAVNSQTLGISGSVYSDVTIPNLQETDLSVSDVAIVAHPNSKVAPADAFVGTIPVVPTTQRAFTRSHDVRAFVRLYRSARSAVQDVDVALVLVDTLEREVPVRHERLRSTDFRDGRYIDLEVALPMSSLSTGPHLVSARVSGGAVAIRREVEIVVY